MHRSNCSTIATGNSAVPQVRLAPPTKMKIRMIGIDVMNSNIPTSTMRTGQMPGVSGLVCSTSPNLMYARGLLRMVWDSHVNG